MIKHDFQATEKIIFDGMLERNGLNYQPMTDRMTQCASELNPIKYFIFKTIVVNIYRPLHYLICFVCFLDVVLLVTCRKFTKQTNYAQE